MAAIGEYYKKYQGEQLCKERLSDIYWASPDVRQLSDRMDTLAPYFEDMIFEPNSTTGRFIAVKAKGLYYSPIRSILRYRAEMQV